MNRAALRAGKSEQAGITLLELMVAMGLMAIIAYASSMIYFSALRVHNDHIWRLKPYDEATAAVKRVSDELRDAMLIVAHSDEAIVVTVPAKDTNGDCVLTLGEDGYVLTEGESIAFYLSDETGALDAQGNSLWKAVRGEGESSFSPRIKVADDIYPELNPTDPDTGEPEPMFRCWPDDDQLWGVEVYMTSISVVRGEQRAQTAHSEVYLRNL